MSEIEKMYPLSSKKIRIHLLARYWYCAAESKLRVVEGVVQPWTKVIGGGLRIDDWLKLRPKSPFELQLLQKIGDAPYTRQLGEYTIIAHPDDLAVDYLNYRRTVIIEEYKTVNALKQGEYPSYSLATAKFQLLGYAWVMLPAIQTAGHDLAPKHFIHIYRRRDGRLLKSYVVAADLVKWEREAREIIEVWENKRPLIAPMPSKCVFCHEVYKTRCPLWSAFSVEERRMRTRQ